MEGIDLVHPLHAAQFDHLLGARHPHILFRHLEDKADVVLQAISVGGQKLGGGQGDRHMGVVTAVVGHSLVARLERNVAHVVHLEAIHVGTEGDGRQHRVNHQIAVETGEARVVGDPVAEFAHQLAAVGRGLELDAGSLRNGVQVVAHFLTEVAQGQQGRFNVDVVHQMIPCMVKPSWATSDAPKKQQVETIMKIRITFQDIFFSSSS